MKVVPKKTYFFHDVVLFKMAECFIRHPLWQKISA
jgi:hypothetical protein